MLRMRGDCGRVGRFERVSNEFLNATLITSTRKVTRCVAQPAVERSQHPAAGCGIPPTHRSVTRNARCGSTNAPHSVRAHPTGPPSPAPQLRAGHYLGRHKILEKVLYWFIADFLNCSGQLTSVCQHAHDRHAAGRRRLQKMSVSTRTVSASPT